MSSEQKAGPKSADDAAKRVDGSCKKGHSKLLFTPASLLFKLDLDQVVFSCALPSKFSCKSHFYMIPHIEKTCLVLVIYSDHIGTAKSSIMRMLKTCNEGEVSRPK